VGQAAVLKWLIDGPNCGTSSFEQARSGMALARQVIECIRDGVVVTTQPSTENPPRVVFTNASFEAMLVCPSHCGFYENGDHPPSDDASGDDPLWGSLKESHRSNAVYLTDIMHRSRDGARILLHLRSEPIRDESGKITHRVAVFHDGTRQANLEEAARRNEQLACIGLLAAEIAHEINNPLGSALLAAETALTIKESQGGEDHVSACLRNIVTSMDRCGRIVRTLLRYSRHEPVEKQACNINDVVEQAVDLARPYMKPHKTDVRLDVDPAIPLVAMNPLEIELVLSNLLRNAIEAGNEKVVVSIATMPIDGGVRVTVSDNGCGMTEELIAHVFDPLFTTRRHKGGSGLGMSIALGIIQAHQGRMEVRSQEGKGTTVTIDLPVAGGGAMEPNGNQGRDTHGSNLNC
jgi:signal transduction histidine kinase